MSWTAATFTAKQFYGVIILPKHQQLQQLEAKTLFHGCLIAMIYTVNGFLLKSYLTLSLLQIREYFSGRWQLDGWGH